MSFMLSASIVLYNTSHEQINMLLESVSKSNCVQTLYIIDNSPNEENQELFKTSKLCNNIEYIPHENTGYGSSHNIAIKKAIECGSDYHIILNPDIYFESNVLSELVHYMDINTDVGYILPKVTYPNGEKLSIVVD